MLRILGRGHSVPTVTELILVRAHLLKHFGAKEFYASRNNNWIQTEIGPVECLIGWKVFCLVCLNIYNPVHPSCTRITRCHKVLASCGIYEMTSAHYPLSCLLLHTYYSTFRDPCLRWVPSGVAGLAVSCPFLRPCLRSSSSIFIHLFFLSPFFM